MIKKENIFVNENYWRHMKSNELELEIFINDIFQYYRKNGFPYYSTNSKIRNDEFSKLKNFNRQMLFENNTIKQTMHGLGLAWSYFPHSFDIKCNNKLTPYEAFMNDEIFKKVIRKRLQMGTYVSDSGIRKMLKIYTGVQGVSNFRPTAAATIYDKFAKNGVVWDMSGGWGGRLLGAIVSNVDTYIATEPSKKTADGLKEISNDFGKNISLIEIYEQGSETFKPEKNSLDLCFTSPPYFNLEKYSNELTQSYIKFNTKENWIEGFLRPTLLNCYYGLKSSGYLLINIADPKGKENINLESKTKEIANEIGFNLIDIIQLALSNVNLKEKTNKFKFEPIFLFIKK